MKFGKEFELQMVPEWRTAYMDYNCLKKILKEVLRLKKQISQTPVATKGVLKRKESLYRAFSGLTSRYKASPRNEDEAIVVDGGGGDGEYKTMFVVGSDVGGEHEHEREFFVKLDDEFNKVVSFYKEKVEGVLAEADELSKQMDTLIALRIKVEAPILLARAASGVSSNMSRSASSRGSSMGTIKDQLMKMQEKEGKEKPDRVRRPAALDHVKIKIEPETPLSTIKGLLSGFTTGITFTAKELKNAEELMTRAFTEFYQKLRVLKSFSFLNHLAFTKILKKYDKITARNAAKAYMQMVDKSYLGSDEVSKLMGRLETTFIKHFANGNHRKGMDILRPKTKRERHTITFLLGTFFGCSLASLVAIIVTIHARDILQSEGRNNYMNTIFPLYSFFFYIVLHLLMFSGDIFFWQYYRVNHTFIFGLKKGTELGYREVLLIGSALSVLTFGCILSNLDMEMDPRTKKFEALTEIVPLALLVFLLLVTLCPFNILYRSSRYFILQCLFHCLCAPLYKVTLPDFFFGDQLTSQVQALRSLELYICYYGWGDYVTRSNKCKQNYLYNSFYLIVAIIPYWIRFVQCVRRLIEEKDTTHITNGMKYFSTIVAVSSRTAHEFRPGRGWFLMATVSSVAATVINTYWDLVVDWGLLQRNSRNRWLRDKLILPNHSVYFIAMVVNVSLRMAWMQSVLGIREAPFLHRTALTAVIASLEIIRRGIWNFFRLENEHLNNVGKYRAFKSVPLPFNYDDQVDKNA